MWQSVSTSTWCTVDRTWIHFLHSINNGFQWLHCSYFAHQHRLCTFCYNNFRFFFVFVAVCIQFFIRNMTHSSHHRWHCNRILIISYEISHQYSKAARWLWWVNKFPLIGIHFFTFPRMVSTLPKSIVSLHIFTNPRSLTVCYISFQAMQSTRWWNKLEADRAEGRWKEKEKKRKRRIDGEENKNTM